ncbi:ABC transporter permease, partial [Streptococcus suis]
GDQPFEYVGYLDQDIFTDFNNTLNAAVMVFSDDTVLDAVREYYESNYPQGYTVSLDDRVFPDLYAVEVASIGQQSGDS